MQRSLYTEQSLRRGVFTHKSLYTKKSLHRGAFAQSSFYTEKSVHRGAFTRRSFYTEELLRREVFTQKSFYTQKLLHREASTQRSLYTEELLHTEAFTRSFYTNKSWHRLVSEGSKFQYCTSFRRSTFICAKGLHLIFQNCNYILHEFLTFEPHFMRKGDAVALKIRISLQDSHDFRRGLRRKQKFSPYVCASDMHDLRWGSCFHRPSCPSRLTREFRRTGEVGVLSD